MKTFKGQKFFEVVLDDLSPVAADLDQHFRSRGYETEKLATSDGSWQVNITKGGKFKAIAGQRTGLTIAITRRANGTLIEAGAGVLGRQAALGIATLAVSTAMLPLMLVPIWGLIKQAGLDNEAIKVAEVSLTRLQRVADFDAVRGAGIDPGPQLNNAVSGPVTQRDALKKRPSFCSECGDTLAEDARFCSNCGQATSMTE